MILGRHHAAARTARWQRKIHDARADAGQISEQSVHGVLVPRGRGGHKPAR